MVAARPNLAYRLGVPTWRPVSARPDLASRIGVPARPDLASRIGGSSASRMSYLLRYNLGGSRGCVIVHTGGTPLYPPKIGVIPARPDLAKILTGSIQRVPAN